MRYAQTYTKLAEALAFLGNSLLSPMNQTSSVGLDSAFWETFPDFGNEDITQAVNRCASYAENAQRQILNGGNAVQDASVEYTKLFVGPPKPAAAPWESFYRGDDVTSGFGKATFDMQRRLRDAGLQVSNENNQYADHAGIELLYLSVLCERAASAEEGLPNDTADFVDRFLDWTGRLLATVDDVAPGGYISCILQLARALVAYTTQVE